MLLIHTAAGSGTVLSMHYCMGSLASMQIGHKDELGCAKCGMKNSDCCHDDVKIVKIDNAQFIGSSVSSIEFQDQLFFNTISFWPYFSSIVANDVLITTPIVFNGGPPIFILNCNFRI
jgi:hypothetical protein